LKSFINNKLLIARGPHNHLDKTGIRIPPAPPLNRHESTYLGNGGLVMGQNWDRLTRKGCLRLITKIVANNYERPSLALAA